MGTSTRVLWFGVAAAVCSYFFGLYIRSGAKTSGSVEQSILEAWNRIVETPSIEFKKILVGINCNVDLIIGGVHLLSKLNVRPGKSATHDEIKSMDDFQETFSYYFNLGAPAERFLINPDVFQQLTKIAEKDKSAEFQVGGNSALMAQKVAATFPGTKVILVGPVGPRLKTLLHSNVQTQNSTKIPKDEIHLIMEYKQGDKWGKIVSPSSSRFITSHDNFSSSAVVLDVLFKSVVTTKPDLVVLSGLHLMESQPPDTWRELMKLLKHYLMDVNHLIPIHLELGCMTDKEFVKTVLHRIVPYVDSLGLNQHELMFLSKVGNGPFADAEPLSSGSFEAHKTTEVLHWMMSNFGRNPKNTDSKKFNFRLQRIHFHCLTYHMMVTRGPDWSNGAAALSAGTRVAGIQACNGLKRVDSDTVELKLPKEFLVDEKMEKTYKLNPHNPVFSWMRDDVLYLLTPVLVCKEPQKTVGLGDAISATGLMFSQFYRFEK